MTGYSIMRVRSTENNVQKKDDQEKKTKIIVNGVYEVEEETICGGEEVSKGKRD